MSIKPDIMERLGLGAGDGTDMQLVEVSGTGHAGGQTARRYVERHRGARKEDILSVEYAGRGDHGDPVYLVTWQTEGGERK